MTVQFIGPLLVKWAIHRAGEAGGAVEQLYVAEGLFQKEIAEHLWLLLKDTNSTEEIEEHFKEFIRSEKAVGSINLVLRDFIDKKKNGNNDLSES